MALVRLMKLGDGRERKVSFSQFSLRVMGEVSKVPPWIFLLKPEPGLERTQVLAWGALQRWVHSSEENAMSFEQFLMGDLLPEYFSPDWFRLERDLQTLLDETFPSAVQMRTSMAALDQGSAQSETTSN